MFSPRRPSLECPASRSNVDAAERRREVAADGLHVVGVRRDDDPVHEPEYGRIGHRVRVIPLHTSLDSVGKERHGVSRVELGAGDAVDLVPGERRRLDARAAVGGHALYLLRRELVLLDDAGKAVEGAVEHAAARVGLVVHPARERPRLPELVRDLVRVPGLVADIVGEAVLRVVEDGGVARVTHLGQEDRRQGAGALPAGHAVLRHVPPAVAPAGVGQDHAEVACDAQGMQQPLLVEAEKPAGAGGRAEVGVGVTREAAAAPPSRRPGEPR